MAVNSTQTRTRSNARTARTPATPAAPARRTRPGQVAAAPPHPVRRPPREAVIEAFDSARYAALLGDLDRLAHDPPLGPQAAAPASDVLPAAVRQAYRQEPPQREARPRPSALQPVKPTPSQMN